MSKLKYYTDGEVMSANWNRMSELTRTDNRNEEYTYRIALQQNYATFYETDKEKVKETLKLVIESFPLENLKMSKYIGGKKNG